MGPFGGWEMPISYADGGIVAEHHAVRDAVGVFDVSHLGKARVAGAGAAAFVNRCLSADLAKITPGQAQYTLCCNDSGGVIDDLIAYLVSEDEVFLVPNAANTTAVLAAMQAVAPDGITIENQHRGYAVIAVQGPAAAEVLTAIGLPAQLGYMSWQDADGVRVCRTGYTGEQGYELICPAAQAPQLWETLLAQATPRGGRPAALGARDTLRTEMGYPLHGQDLSPEISPVQAGSSWAVGWKKPEFFGRDALLAEKATGPTRRLRGLLALERGVLRPHLTVRADDGTEIGQTTSGTFSPTLSKGIALALIDADAQIADGATVSVDVRGRALRTQVLKPPFVESHVR